ncbi:septin-10 isoform X3 [Columba livia]|uniref:septin-10 isoform X3 n=1 Tax=Columba livia TaxID=8932 RepID=UPI0031BAB227
MLQQLRVARPPAPLRQEPHHRLLLQLRHHRPYPIASRRRSSRCCCCCCGRGGAAACPSPSSRRRHARQSLPPRQSLPRRRPRRATLRPGGARAAASRHALLSQRRQRAGRRTPAPLLPAPVGPPRPRPAVAPPVPGGRQRPVTAAGGCAPSPLSGSALPASPGGAMAASHSGWQPQYDGYRTLSLSGHVGFASLPDQLVKKSIKQGFCFNILCIGETGSGKSTLISSLFNTDFDDPVSTHFLPSVRLRAQTYELQENNVHLKLTIVNTVGFGDQMNKEDNYRPIVDYIDTQFEAYLQEELEVKRSLFCYHDTRIHVCLYFISPTGHSLKSLDLLTMKRLDSKVNIIPIIGKADSISKTELQKFKNKIMNELINNDIQIYQFPTDDETVSEINTIMNGHLPFAVVGSMEEVKIGNKMVRARQYPWGIVQVENENHCDFVKLRKMLICTNMEDLREQTHVRHYELYRRCRLEEMGFRDIDTENRTVRLPCSESYADGETVCHSCASEESLQEAIEAQRHEFHLELQRKEEEIRQELARRLKEKDAILKEAKQQMRLFVSSAYCN